MYILIYIYTHIYTLYNVYVYIHYIVIPEYFMIRSRSYGLLYPSGLAQRFQCSQQCALLG